MRQNIKLILIVAFKSFFFPIFQPPNVQLLIIKNFTNSNLIKYIVITCSTMMKGKNSSFIFYSSI